MELAYSSLDIHGLISTNPISLWILACSVVMRARVIANLSVVFTFVSRERRVSVVNFSDPRSEVIMLIVLRFPSWRRGVIVPASHGSREG